MVDEGPQDRLPGDEVGRRGEPARRGDVTNGLVRVDRRVATAVLAIVPWLALLAFFGTGSWLWFLAIPLVGIVLLGKGGKGDDGRNERGVRD